jgi:WXG100 family type VII secretion target
MSTSFQVDPERIAAASGDIARISAEIETQVGAMMGRLTALEDAWRGQAATRFQTVAAQWRGAQTHVRQALDDIAVVLGQAGQQYAAAEQQNAAMFR